MRPTQIKRISGQKLEIKWSDGILHEISSKLLRKNCPCASCAEARGDMNHAKPLSAPAKKSMLSIIKNSIDEETNLLEIWAIGNYALGCRWGDGHATGIYSFAKLRELGEINRINPSSSEQTNSAQ